MSALPLGKVQYSMESPTSLGGHYQVVQIACVSSWLEGFRRPVLCHQHHHHCLRTYLVGIAIGVGTGIFVGKLFGVTCDIIVTGNSVSDTKTYPPHVGAGLLGVMIRTAAGMPPSSSLSSPERVGDVSKAICILWFRSSLATATYTLVGINPPKRM